MGQAPDEDRDDPGTRPDQPEASLEARLNAARLRRGLDRAPKIGAVQGFGDGGSNPWGVGLRVGVEMLSALVVAVAIGWGLDRWLHTRPIFLAVFVLLGGAAGVMNVWRMVAPRNSPPPKR